MLLVEDDPSAQELIARELESIAAGSVERAASLAEAFAQVTELDLDCIVLDLSLPDGWGLDTLLQVRRRADPTPIVVVSGSQNDRFAAKAIRSGAAGFVQKFSATNGQIAQAVLDAVSGARSGERHTDPISELGALGARRTPVTAGIFGQVELAEALPDSFGDLAAQYSDLLELALERTAFVASSSVGDHLRALANSLGAVGAGPRDVVKLHAQALEIQADKRQGPGAPTFQHEARLVVLELMGYLVSYYRLQTLGRPPSGEESD